MLAQQQKTFLQVDLKALAYNYQFFKEYIGEKTNILAVIKAFAYGHESIAVAKELEKKGVAYFAVAYIQEGIFLRKAGITTPILVFHPQIGDIQDCIRYNLEPTIYNFRLLDIYQKELDKENITNFPIHLKFNTGLNRLGFSKDAIRKIQEKTTNFKNFEVTSIFSHLVASEDLNEKDFTLGQIEKYKEIVIEFQKQYKKPFIKHLTNTSGTINYPDAHFDMVRIGIGLYGYANDKKWTSKLKNVSGLYSVISQKHIINKGESVGYNRAFIASVEVVSATIPIGHADGIPRTWGNGTISVIVNGQKAKILGNVCMDMIMVDVTNIKCQEGDLVTIFDSQELLENIAQKTNTISYEILTAISQRVSRVIKED